MRHLLLFILPALISCTSREPHEPRYVIASDAPAERPRPRINPASYNPNTAFRAGGFGSSPIPGTSNYIPQPKPRPTPAGAIPAPSTTTPAKRQSSLARDSQGNLSTITPNTRGGYTVRDADGDVRTITPRAGGGYTIRERGGQTRVVSKLPSGNTAYEP